MKKTKYLRGFYTAENSDLYMLVVPKYSNEEYMKCKIFLYYKYGEYKGVLVENPKNYKIYYSNIQHWISYE